jgi:glycosyltransferase involved in cell wall biosynthesis
MSFRIFFFLTHPVQYFAPFFRELALRPEIDLTVLFAHNPNNAEQGRGFGVPFQWDCDLTEGYRHRFLPNAAKHPTDGFWGYDTPSIKDVIRCDRPDFFIAQGWSCKSMLQALIACKMLSVPIAVRSDSQLSHGADSPVDWCKKLLKQLFYPAFFRAYNLCLPYGTRSADYFYHFGAKEVQVIPHVVDGQSFALACSQARERRMEIRKRFGIPKNTTCFLFCGKFETKKRSEDILRALEILVERGVGDNISALLVGSGELCKELGTFSESRRLPATFAGFLNQSEIPTAYAAADVLILPSDYRETWGLVVNEAMACGLPAIVSDSCGCAPDLVFDGLTGLRYSTGSSEQLAMRMLELIDLDVRSVMGNNAHQLIQSRFTISGAVGQLIYVVGEYIGRNRR